MRAGGLAAAVWLCGVSLGVAQRVQFPSMVAGQPAAAGAPVYTLAQTWDPYAEGGSAGQSYAPVQPYQPQAGAYQPPPVYGGATQPYSPYSPTPSALYPDAGPQIVQPYAAQPYAGQPVMVQPQGESFMRLMQQVQFESAWLFGDGGDDLQVIDLEVSATFAYPFLNSQAPLLITPGFAVHFFKGPTGAGLGADDLPPRTYDVYLDLGWNPQFTPFFGAELGIRPGLYTDFDTVNSDSLRILGRAMAVLNLSERLQIKAGAIYLDRLDVKLLPAGGVFYTPDPDTKWEIFFPRPRYAHRFTTVGNHGWWWYVAGEYGGGSWSIERASGASDQFDYNDLRAYGGVEWLPETQGGVRGFFEIGWVFEREIIYRSNLPPGFEPADTLMVRSGIAF